MKGLLILPILLLSSFSLLAQEAPEIPAFLIAYADFLGMTIDEALEDFGAPDHLSTYQGEEDEYGSVIFYYQNSLSLFWVDDRVWQLRLDNHFADPDHPGLIGQSMDRIMEDWGEPQFHEEELLIYDIPESDYPVRCALYFSEEEELIDLYIFRGDY